jgi:hypothetical protein
VDGLQIRYGKTGMPRLIALDPERLAVDEESSTFAKRLRPIG